MGTRSNLPNLTSSEAGSLLGVHPSTIKRWCDRGDLSSRKTEGGHRRIELKTLLDYAAGSGRQTILDAFQPWQANVWLAMRAAEAYGDFGRLNNLALGWLQRGEIGLLGQLFYRAGQLPGLPLPLFIDEGMRGFMAAVGEAWRDGRLGIGEEHLATQTMEEVLLRLRLGWNRDPASLSASRAGERMAVVGGIEGDHHDLGAQAVRAVLERAGWLVYFLGPNVPSTEFAKIQRAYGASLVCISCSQGGNLMELGRVASSLSALYRPGYPYHLAFGGPAWGFDGRDLPGEPFESVNLFSSAGAFSEWLERVPLGNTSQEERVA